ncbi:unnamed protein product, partial [Callosobruchus maculatus]
SINFIKKSFRSFEKNHIINQSYLFFLSGDWYKNSLFSLRLNNVGSLVLSPLIKWHEHTKEAIKSFQMHKINNMWS